MHHQQTPITTCFYIFWDLENVSILADRVPIFIYNIMKQIEACSQAKYQIKLFKCYSDVLLMKDSRLREELNNNGVEVVDTPHLQRKKEEICDKYMQMDMLFSFNDTVYMGSQLKHHFILISGDGGFTFLLNRLKMKGVDVTVIAPDSCSQSLKHHFVLWNVLYFKEMIKLPPQHFSNMYNAFKSTQEGGAIPNGKMNGTAFPHSSSSASLAAPIPSALGNTPVKIPAKQEVDGLLKTPPKPAPKSKIDSVPVEVKNQPTEIAVENSSSNHSETEMITTCADIETEFTNTSTKQTADNDFTMEDEFLKPIPSSFSIGIEENQIVGEDTVVYDPEIEGTTQELFFNHVARQERTPPDNTPEASDEEAEDRNRLSYIRRLASGLKRNEKDLLSDTRAQLAYEVLKRENPPYISVSKLGSLLVNHGNTAKQITDLLQGRPDLFFVSEPEAIGGNRRVATLQYAENNLLNQSSSKRSANKESPKKATKQSIDVSNLTKAKQIHAILSQQNSILELNQLVSLVQNDWTSAKLLALVKLFPTLFYVSATRHNITYVCTVEYYQSNKTEVHGRCGAPSIAISDAVTEERAKVVYFLMLLHGKKQMELGAIASMCQKYRLPTKDMSPLVSKFPQYFEKRMPNGPGKIVNITLV